MLASERANWDVSVHIVNTILSLQKNAWFCVVHWEIQRMVWPSVFLSSREKNKRIVLCWVWGVGGVKEHKKQIPLQSFNGWLHRGEALPVSFPGLYKIRGLLCQSCWTWPGQVPGLGPFSVLILNFPHPPDGFQLVLYYKRSILGPPSLGVGPSSADSVSWPSEGLRKEKTQRLPKMTELEFVAH